METGILCDLTLREISKSQIGGRRRIFFFSNPNFEDEKNML